jgi:hypothetical protein
VRSQKVSKGTWCAKKRSLLVKFGPKQAICVPHHLMLSRLDESHAPLGGRGFVAARRHRKTRTMPDWTDIEMTPCHDDVQWWPPIAKKRNSFFADNHMEGEQGKAKAARHRAFPKHDQTKSEQRNCISKRISHLNTLSNHSNRVHRLVSCLSACLYGVRHLIRNELMRA